MISTIFSLNKIDRKPQAILKEALLLKTCQEITLDVVEKSTIFLEDFKNVVHRLQIALR